MNFKPFFYVFFVLTIVFCTSCQNNSDNNIRIFSFNIRYNNPKDGNNVWANRCDAVVDMINFEKPSLIGFQEVLIDQLTFIEENLPQYGRIGVGRNDGMQGGEHMAIFYLKDRFSLLESGNFWLNETPEQPVIGWDAVCKRMVTWGFFKDLKNGKSFYLFNTHLDHVGKIARKESISLIAKKITAISGNESTVFLTGDFNSTADDAIFDPIKELLSDSRKDAKNTDEVATFNGFGTATSAQIIDFIFYRNAMPVTFRTLNGFYGAEYISDHYPISADFDLDF